VSAALLLSGASRTGRAAPPAWQLEERKQAMSRNLKALCLGLFAALAFSAFAASAAQAEKADFAAGEYPAEIHWTQDPDEPVQKFQSPVGTLTCEEVTGTATLAEQSQTLTGKELTGKPIEYRKCHFSALKIPVTIDMNGCHFTFNAGTITVAGTSSGSVKIENCQEGKGITTTIFNNADHKEEHRTCTMHVLEQTISPVTYHNKQTVGKKEEVTIKTEAAKVKVTTTHSEVGTLCSAATHEFEFELTGRLTASAVNENTLESIDFTIRGTPGT
jgi:hypothetical protein